MVTNLLDLARLSVGAQPLRRKWQSLEEVFGSALPLLRPALAEPPVHVDLPQDLPLLERVISDLLDNVAKHTPAGCEITLSAAIDGDRARITVCDNGTGYPKLSCLAQPFVCGEAESVRIGAGLGLAFCKAIVAAHGSMLMLKSQPGGGARFSLPLGSPP